MSATRWTVFEALAEASDAESRRTTTVGALAGALGTEEAAVATHLDALEDCDLARVCDDGRARVTVTGEELLALDPDDRIIVAPPDDEAD